MSTFKEIIDEFVIQAFPDVCIYGDQVGLLAELDSDNFIYLDYNPEYININFVLYSKNSDDGMASEARIYYADPDLLTKITTFVTKCINEHTKLIKHYTKFRKIKS